MTKLTKGQEIALDHYLSGDYTLNDYGFDDILTHIEEYESHIYYEMFSDEELKEEIRSLAEKIDLALTRAIKEYKSSSQQFLTYATTSKNKGECV